jgi:hypothetical protein
MSALHPGEWVSINLENHVIIPDIPIHFTSFQIISPRITLKSKCEGLLILQSKGPSPQPGIPRDKGCEGNGYDHQKDQDYYYFFHDASPFSDSPRICSNSP